jgi:hypothetical protein
MKNIIKIIKCIFFIARFRASTHYRTELIPEERAVRLTDMLNYVADQVRKGLTYLKQNDATYWQNVFVMLTNVLIISLY